MPMDGRKLYLNLISQRHSIWRQAASGTVVFPL
jgi:hypothetical protein